MPAVHCQESSARQRRERISKTIPAGERISETIPAPYPWATTHRATVHSQDYLLSNAMFIITGEVQCEICERKYNMEYDLREEFPKVRTFIAENKRRMNGWAPEVWMNPVLLDCKFCNRKNRVKPIISEKKRSINWLFLLLGQMLGFCQFKQLRYFCKHTKKHPRDDKSYFRYTTYIGLCKQLKPNETFDL